MRLTSDHIRRAPHVTNAILQREIDLRGLGISSLDGHALVQLSNAFDVINLCNNVLSCLENFPTHFSKDQDTRLTRVNTVIVHRNRLQKVHADSCARALPNVRFFAADSNHFLRVRDLTFLQHWPRLETVSLQCNPVWKENPEGFSEEDVRAFMVYMCGKLRLIDNERVTDRDRSNASANTERFAAFMRDCCSGARQLTSGGKVRKRGRHANASAAATAEAGATTRDDQVDTEEERQLKYARLEERLNDPNTTHEELQQLELEMLALSRE